MNINLHIDAIVLNDIDLSPQRQAEFRTSLSRELTQLFSEREMVYWRMQRSLSVIQAAPINMGSRPDASQLGQQVAQRIFSGLAHEPSTCNR